MLEPGTTYHIYNRANGSENLFREEKNYGFFLDKYFRHIDPIARTYAYCLMPNHFHVMVQVRKVEEIVFNLKMEHRQNQTGLQDLSGLLSKQFGNLFNGYAKAINKTYNRRGSLFQRPFKYKKVESDEYFRQLILYIHNNPVKHGFVANTMDWMHSSIHQFTSKIKASGFEKPDAFVDREAVIDWFGDLKRFELAHGEGDEKCI